jgi:hypothetical protein
MSPKKFLPILALSATTTACQIQAEPSSRTSSPANGSGLETSGLTGDTLIEASPSSIVPSKSEIQRVREPIGFRGTHETPPLLSIVGGDTTSDFEAVGAIVVLDRAGDILASFCSGTLIDDSTVLTAAHCVDGMRDIEALGFTDFEFVIGTNVYTPYGAWERLAITETISHPNWDPDKNGNDIALLRLKGPSELAEPVQLNHGIDPADWLSQDITYVGWGDADDTSADTSGIKRTVDVPVYAIYDSLIITHSENNQNLCYGDSGGAAFLTDETGQVRLAGVNTFIFSLEGRTPTCEGSDSAAGAERVDFYLDWIGEYVELEPAHHADPIVYSDSSGTLTTGETVTLTIDSGGAEVYDVHWDLENSETTNNGRTVQDARWNAAGTYTVVAEVELEDGSFWTLSQTFTVLELDLDIGFVRCDDGSMGVGVTLTGTHSEGTYGLYGSSDLSSWTALDIEISGEDDVTTWNNCDVSLRPDAFFFRAAVEDNPDGDEWTTGQELLVTGTDPWKYEEGQNCMLVEDDGSWETLRTSAEACTDFEGALSSGLIFTEIVSTGGTTFQNPTAGVQLPEGWDGDADDNEIDAPHNPWIKDTNDCDDFAEDFEDAMEADGYDVTITILIEFDKETCSRPISGHALNDFHDSEGRIGFWEPQNNRIVDLDLDGDGFVNLAPYRGVFVGPTERSPGGKCISVEIFDDFDDLVRSGYPID